MITYKICYLLKDALDASCYFLENKFSFAFNSDFTQYQLCQEFSQDYH